MLVLSRKKNESIVIADEITIVVVEIRGDKVRLGVEAPKEVPVMRTEVYEAIQRCKTCDDYTPYAPIAPVDIERSREQSSQPAPFVDVLEVEAPSPDGLCCPQCQSARVHIERIKVAFRGAELVRWRQCLACGYRFHTLEKVQEL